MIKKIFCMMLLIAILCTTLVGCKTSKTNDEETTSVSTVVTLSREEELDPKLEAENFGGTFTFLARWDEGSGTFLYKELTPSEEGSTLDAGIYTRNDNIQKKYGIEIVPMYEPRGQEISRATTDSMSGLSGEYDAYLISTDNALSLATNGILQSLGDVPYMNLEKAYYDQSLMKDTTIAGRNYLVHGHFSPSTYIAVGGLYINKEMLSNYHLDDPYALVRSGKWTWEKMLEMCKNVTVIEENGEPNVGQYQYGIATGTYTWQPLFFSTGKSLVVKDQEGMPLLNLSECIDVIQRINDLLNNPETTFFNQSTSIQAQFNGAQIFTAKRSLFMSDPLYSVTTTLLPSDIEYGILPFPKYTEDQETYYSQTHAGHSSVLAVPKVNADLEKTGKILEDFAFQSSIHVYPVIMDNMIKLRNAQTENDYEMLEIMFADVRCDLGLALGKVVKIDTEVRNLIKGNSTDIASTLSGNYESYQTALDNFVTSWIGE